MAKAQQPAEKPKVSKLPLPISDSPLVIDLPDGQKIVVGKMTQGSVIEVATWRGVGRPDSRTSRLMLGVGMGNVQEEPESSQQVSNAQSKPRKPEDWRVILFYINIALNKVTSIQWAAFAKKLLAVKPPKRVKKVKNVESAKAPVSSAELEVASSSTPSKISSMDDDIEAWLNKISEKAVQKSGETAKSAKTPAKKATTVKKAVKKQATSKAKRK